jgi:hypothetical protein
MNPLAYAGVLIAVLAGIALAVFYYWKKRSPAGSFLLFLLPVLIYFLWHFSVEAYNWGLVWEETLARSNSGEVTLEVSTAAALVDLKLIFSVFMLLFWIYVWNGVDTAKKK